MHSGWESALSHSQSLVESTTYTVFGRAVPEKLYLNVRMGAVYVTAQYLGELYLHSIWESCTCTVSGRAVPAQYLAEQNLHTLWESCTCTVAGRAIPAQYLGELYLHSIWESCTCTVSG
jgi:hypothetical protein